MCEHVSNLAFRKEIFSVIHYIQPPENNLITHASDNNPDNTKDVATTGSHPTTSTLE